MRGALSQLVMTTLTDPAGAARQLLDLRLTRETLWIALALAVVLNTAMQTLSGLLLPETPDLVPQQLRSPTIFGALLFMVVTLTVAAISFVGRKLGGAGRFDEVMVLIVWLQFLRALLHALVLVLLLVAPLLALLLQLAGSLVGVYIMLHFVDQAHRLNSLGRAAWVLVASVLAMALVLYVFLALAGGPISGNPSYV